MSRENLRRSLLRRALGASPDWLRDLAWRRFPRSQIRQAAIEALARWNYHHFNKTGVIPTEMFSPGVEVHQAPELIGTAGTFNGHAGLRAVMVELHEAWGKLEFHPREIREFGDRAGIVVVAHARNVGLGSGVMTDRHVAHIFWVRNGGVARFDTYWDPARALEAVGLRDQRRDTSP